MHSKAQSLENRFESIDMSGETESHQFGQKKVSIVKIILDIFSLVALLVIWLLLKYLVKPIRRAFSCSDLSLYQREASDKVFPTWLLSICCFVIPLIILIISECIKGFYLRKRADIRSFYNLKVGWRIFKIPGWIGNLYIVITVFLLACGVTVVLTNIGKVTVGRPRPHFMETCLNVTSYNTYCTNPNQWISNYTCIGESDEASKAASKAYDVRQSFPSGHASSAFCGLIFLAIYIHLFWKYQNFGLLPAIIQTVCFALASYISITRVTDHRHHPTDVLAGAILGTFVAVISFFFLLRFLKQSSSSALTRNSTNY